MTPVNEDPGVLLYTRIRKSPYFYASRRHGIQLYSVYNHTYHPRHYGDPVEEYWHLLNGVTLWDVGVERQIEISGPDAFDFTNLLVARDLNKCAVEQCKYVFLCLPDGGIINDPVLLRVEENRFWLSLADSDVELWARGVAYNSSYDVTIKEIDVGPVQVQGPKSKDVMVDLFGDSILEIPYYYMRPVRARRHEGARLAHGLHRRARLRDLPLRGEQERREAVGRGARGRQAARPRGDRALPHPADRGRHPRPRPGLRHVVRHEPLRGRDGLRLDGRPRGRLGLHRQGGAPPDQGGGPQAQARGRRDRRRAARLLQRRLDDRRVRCPQGREPDRRGHVGLLLAAAREEHRLRDGADRALRARHRARGRAARGQDLGRGGPEAVHRSEEGDAEAGARGRVPGPEHVGPHRLRAARRRAARRARSSAATCWCSSRSPRCVEAAARGRRADPGRTERRRRSTS